MFANLKKKFWNPEAAKERIAEGKEKMALIDMRRDQKLAALGDAKAKARIEFREAMDVNNEKLAAAFGKQTKEERDRIMSLPLPPKG